MESKSDIKVDLESSIGDEYNREWLDKRLKELRKKGYEIEFVVLGDPTKAKSLREAQEVLDYVKKSREGASVQEVTSYQLSQKDYLRSKRFITIASAGVGLAGTTATVYIGLGAAFIPSLMVGMQAAVIHAIWMHKNEAFFYWIRHKGVFPPAERAKIASQFETFGKQLAVGTVAGMIIQYGARLAAGMTNFSIPALTAETAWVVAQSLMTRHYFRQSQFEYAEQEVRKDPKMRERMELWKMRTSVYMTAAFTVVQQLILFDVPHMSYVLYGLGASGYGVYKYVTDVRVRDALQSLKQLKNPIPPLFKAKTCKALF